MRPRRGQHATTQSPHFKSEHLIFVKNVPQYIAKSSIPRLFQPYNPNRMKNIYPTSSNTTIVIGFDDAESAWRAQSDTNGLRLENVILRVEGFERERSIAFNRRKRRGIVVDEDDDAYEGDYEEYSGEQEEEPPLTAKSVEFPPLLEANRKSAVVGDWAKKIEELKIKHAEEKGADKKAGPARNRVVLRSSVTRAAVAAKKSAEESYEDDTESTAVESSTTATIPSDHKFHHVVPSTKNATVPDAPVQPATPSVIQKSVETYEPATQHADDKENKQPMEHSGSKGHSHHFSLGHRYQPLQGCQYDSIFAPWNSVDTTSNIRLRHARDCAFCKLYIRTVLR